MMVDLMFHRDASAGTAFTNAGATFADTRDQALTRAKVDATVRAEERTTSSGTAVLLAEGEGEFLTQHTMIGNVVVMVRVFEAKTSPADTGARAAELMAGLADASEAITAEVAGQLR
ncbi:hypothetical protein [Actinoplanes sp. OR16]|uniref:hypothetical protein n=1 Tax=Actinoplanes sp. OR16 TaxID=946334 RepID=UPI000FDB2660|nr:hypothetical protein [Actinoplanes sp. OR16]